MRQDKKVVAVAADMSRRQALVWAGGALLAVAGVALLARKAAAMTLVEADAQTQALFHSACGPVAYHDKVLADARAALEGGNKAGPPVALAPVDCPVCGCRLQADNGKAEPPR